VTRARFLATRHGDWHRFEGLLGRVEHARLGELAGEEVSELSRLHRAVCYDLSTVRSRDWGPELERRLHDLVVRGHHLLYRDPPGRLRAAGAFVTGGFPRLLRENHRFFWVALLLFLVPAVAAGVAVRLDPSLAPRVLDRQMLEDMESMHSEKDRTEGTGVEAGMTGFYVVNNVGIAFRVFATGVLLGLPTIGLLLFNGLVLGTVFGFLFSRGQGEPLLAFVIGHGAFELTAIVIAGAAGLILGHAILRPGLRSRLDALRARGLVSIQLAIGAGLMLGVAALLEAFWSPSPVPGDVKYAVGILLWLMVIAYLALAGRWRKA
jgi:uncharacterized membrane protein SpoIIM required for sporulation